jgi:hypothetical protein
MNYECEGLAEVTQRWKGWLTAIAIINLIFMVGSLLVPVGDQIYIAMRRQSPKLFAVLFLLSFGTMCWGLRNE